MNSDFEMQTESYVPQKINLVGNLIWSFQLWEQCPALTKSVFSDAQLMESGHPSQVYNLLLHVKLLAKCCCSYP